MCAIIPAMFEDCNSGWERLRERPEIPLTDRTPLHEGQSIGEIPSTREDNRSLAQSEHDEREI